LKNDRSDYAIDEKPVSVETLSEDGQTSRLSEMLNNPAYIRSFGIRKSEGTIAEEFIEPNFNLRIT
jgi:hypothetical protein